MAERKRIYLCLAHMSETGLEQKYIKDAFDTNWVVPLGPNVNGFYRGEDDSLLAENIMNMVVFMPIGLLAGVAFRTMNWKRLLIFSLCLPVGIETLQFVFKKGFSEFDDVIHNTLGCVIGYSIYVLIRKVIKSYDHKICF